MLAGPQEMTGQPLDIFVCDNTLKDGSLVAKPNNFDVTGDVSDDIKLIAADDMQDFIDVALKTLDIFAGVPLSAQTALLPAMRYALKICTAVCEKLPGDRHDVCSCRERGLLAVFSLRETRNSDVSHCV